MAETGKQSSYKKLFSNTLVFAIGSFSSKVLVLLLVPIYTNYLTTAELGVTDVLTQIFDFRKATLFSRVPMRHWC